MKDIICKLVEEKTDTIFIINDKIWEYAETKFNEINSSHLLCNTLADEGFSIHIGAAGLETAFYASYGEGKPVIAILGEYDALSGLSQNADVFVKSPVAENGNGHGCGHNGIAAGTLGAAIAVKNYLKDNHLAGTIIYYGCPAEEGGSGKVYMVKGELFKDVDIALTWHPGPINMVTCGSTYANMQICFKFYGASSHAAVSPHLGRSALDAVELMNVGANYLREHVEKEVSFHYAVTNTGGNAPNVVQSYAESTYLIRATRLDLLSSTYERILNVAKGAALMTGTSVEPAFVKACSNVIPNKTISSLLNKSMNLVGAPDFNEDDLEYAEKLRESLSDKEKNNLMYQLKSFMGNRIKKELLEKSLCNFTMPFMVIETPSPASSDVGDVSWNVPTSQLMMACYAIGTPEHSWQLVAQGKSDIFHKGVLNAAKILALTAAQLFSDPTTIEEAKNELLDRKGNHSYICPIP